MLARLELTDEENDFYRVLLYRVTSSHEYGQPFLRRAFFRLIPVSVYGTGTMAVDQHFRVYIDFAEMMSRGVDYAAGILNHEIWHPLRTHSDRIVALSSAPPGYDKGFLGNIAGDLEINDDISNLLPIVSVMPERSTFRSYKAGQTMEVYYAQLLEDLDRLAEIFPQIKYPDRPDANDQGNDSGEQGDESNQQGDNSSSDSGDQSGSEDGSSQSGSEDESSSESGSGGNDGSSSSADSSSSQSGGSGSGESSSGESSNSSSSQGGGTGSGSGRNNQPGNDGSGSNQPGSGEPSSTGNQENSGSGGDSSDFWSNPVCGSAAGTPQDYELPEGAEAEEMSEVERNTLKEKVAQDIKQYAKEMAAKGVGAGKSGMLSRISKWADEQLKTKYIPWNQEFRGHFMSSYNTQRGKSYYTFSRPARRQPIPKVLFPGTVSPRPTVGLAIDVSGSNLGNLKIILKEIVKIMQATGVKSTEVKAFAVDVEASEVKTVSNPMTLLDDLPVGGGTRMTPGYNRLAELAQNISLLITDGEVYDYPTSMPQAKKHRKRTKFITCIVLNSRDEHSERLIATAKSKVGSWSKVIPIYVEEVQQ